jgi:hypothetical protein
MVVVTAFVAVVVSIGVVACVVSLVVRLVGVMVVFVPIV